MGARSIGGNYWGNITTNSWQLNSDGLYQMTIPNDEHGLGYTCHVNITRLDGGVYKPVALHYEISTSGDITVYSKTAFNGIYYVVSGV